MNFGRMPCFRCLISVFWVLPLLIRPSAQLERFLIGKENVLPVKCQHFLCKAQALRLLLWGNSFPAFGRLATEDRFLSIAFELYPSRISCEIVQILERSLPQISLISLSLQLLRLLLRLRAAFGLVLVGSSHFQSLHISPLCLSLY